MKLDHKALCVRILGGRLLDLYRERALLSFFSLFFFSFLATPQQARLFVFQGKEGAEDLFTMGEAEVELDDVEHHLLEDAAPAEGEEEADMVVDDDDDDADEDDDDDEEEDDAEDDYEEGNDQDTGPVKTKAKERNAAVVAERRRLRELQKLKVLFCS